MKFEDIKKCEDLEEKEKLLIEYYENEINIKDLFKNIQKRTKILFKDRIEIRIDNILSNINGPAIKYKNGNEKYYIDGEFFEIKEDWLDKSKQIKRIGALKTILKKD